MMLVKGATCRKSTESMSKKGSVQIRERFFECKSRMKKQSKEKNEAFISLLLVSPRIRMRNCLSINLHQFKTDGVLVLISELLISCHFTDPAMGN